MTTYQSKKLVSRVDDVEARARLALNHTETALVAARRAYAHIRWEMDARSTEVGRIERQGNLLGEDQLTEARAWLEGTKELRQRLARTEMALAKAYHALDRALGGS